jgi:hypothetical protein
MVRSRALIFHQDQRYAMSPRGAPSHGAKSMGLFPFGTTLEVKSDRTGIGIAGTLALNEEVVMSAYDSKSWGRGLPAGAPALQAVPQVAIHVPEDIKSDILIDLTDSHIVGFEGLTLLLTAQRLAHSEDRQVWLMGLPDNAWSVLEAMGLDDLFVRVSPPGGRPS